MATGNKTSIFVSSTCYDLSQIRAAIYDFSNYIGFDPVMSEFESFPINPNENTVNNCLNAVKSRADIFLLIVGGRYGSISDTGKSITNLEFNEARAKGIPKYVFVKESILNLLPVWKDNPDGNYSSVVDTPKLFEFISEFRDSGEIWVFPFSTAQDIVNTLRTQLSYLFADCLNLRKQVQQSDVDLTELQYKSLRLAIEKPKAWEYLLFAQLLQDSIDKYSGKKLDVELGISLGDPIVLDDIQEITDWTSSRFGWITNTIQQLTAAINAGFIKALGEPGEPSSIERMIHLTSRIGEIYNQLLDWKLKFLRVVVHEDFKKLIELTSEMSSNAICEIEEFASNLYAQIETTFQNAHEYEEGTQITMTLTLTAPENDELHEEIDRLKRKYW
ncbi:MAG: DUF4062 domain-containing protein [Candidatus Thiodiazotropha sp.]